MATLRELKGRIGSVASSEKITGAMKMISSAKMHKAEGTLRRMLPFRQQIESIIANLLGADAKFSSPLTATPAETRHATVVVLGSDDGLCGAYNVNIQKFLASHIASLRDRYGMGLRIDVIAVGRKMVKAAAKLADDLTTVTPAEGVSVKSEGAQLKPFNEHLQELFTSGSTQRVDAVCMSYKSISRQVPEAVQLMPLSTEALGGGEDAPQGKPYLFEPDAQTIFSAALPMYLMATVQELFAQNRVSEQAARVMAMQSANDNAHKLLDQLQLEYNKLRQQSITNELLDIVGGQARE